MQIGIIGLGLLGKTIARRLLACKYKVCGYDIKPAACKTAEADGVRILTAAAGVADNATTLILSLMTSDDRRRLLWGDQRMAEHLPPGSLLLDTTTAKPENIREDTAHLAAQKVRLIDVCISGSSQTVENQQALALVGDTSEAAEPYAPLLEAFTKRQFYFGAPGRGNEAKLVVNTVMGLNRLVLAEALALARAGGFDLAEMLEVLKAGDTYSKVMDTKGGKMAAGNYEPPAARLAQHAKDVALILEYAQHLGIDMPVSCLHHELINRTVDAGAGDLDNAAIFKAYPGSR